MKYVLYIDFQSFLRGIKLPHLKWSLTLLTTLCWSLLCLISLFTYQCFLLITESCLHSHPWFRVCKRVKPNWDNFGLFCWGNKVLHIVTCICQGLWKFLDFTYLWANKSACFCFMVTDRRHETPGSEAKNFIAHSTAGIISFMFTSVLLAPPSPWPQEAHAEGPIGMLDTQQISVMTEEY